MWFHTSTPPYIIKAYIQLNYFGKGTTVVKWSEFLATDPEVPGSIPNTTRFSMKCWNSILTDNTNTWSSNLIQFYSTLNDYTKHIFLTRTSIRNSPTSQVKSSHIMTDSQSASLSWCQAPISDRDQFFPSFFNYFETVTTLMMWDAPSHEKSGLQFFSWAYFIDSILEAPLAQRVIFLYYF
jgi:hypothetical protein